MASLTGQSIASTYKRLLTIDSENLTADASAKYIKDGDAGTSSVLSISTTRVGIGTSSPSKVFHVFDTDAGTTPLAVFQNSGTDEDASISFANDGNTITLGIDGSDSDKFKISDNSTLGTNDRLTIDTSGNIGIGVTDPDTILEVFKAGTQLKLSHNATDYATFAVAADGALTITTVDADAAEGDIILLPDGNVGIGTAAPDEKLHISSGAVVAGTATATTGGAEVLISHYTPGDQNWISMLATEASSGALSIGWACKPKASAAGSFVSTIGGSSLSRGCLVVGDDLEYLSSASATTTAAGSDVTLVSRLYIDCDNGNVGIGVAAPTVPLEVSGDDTHVCQLTNEGSGDGVDGVFIRLQHDSPSTSGYWIALQDSGASSYETEWGVRGDGTDAGATIYDRSDRRLKENIVDIPNAISVVSKLKPRNFTWKIGGKTPSGILRYGFIADEYDEVFPEFVDGKRDSDGKLISDAVKSDGAMFRQMISEKPMIALLTKAIQELSASNDALKARIEVLEAA
jgi:hypothetical protein